MIRNLDEAVVARLRALARQRGGSVEQEARRILAEGAALTRRDVAARARAMRARQKVHQSRASDLVRADRER